MAPAPSSCISWNDLIPDFKDTHKALIHKAGWTQILEAVPTCVWLIFYCCKPTQNSKGAQGGMAWWGTNGHWSAWPRTLGEAREVRSSPELGQTKQLHLLNVKENGQGRARKNQIAVITLENAAGQGELDTVLCMFFSSTKDFKQFRNGSAILPWKVHRERDQYSHTVWKWSSVSFTSAWAQHAGA